MGFYRLSEEIIQLFRTMPEVGMDIQVGMNNNGNYVLVVGLRVALTMTETLDEQLSLYREFTGFSDNNDLPERYEAWTQTLPILSSLRPTSREEGLWALAWLPFGRIRRFFDFEPPSPLYGHLPHAGLCKGNEVFYRYESTPSSARIDLAQGEVILSDTYASPILEVPFIQSGLAAVARYALPSVNPARWRYELRPPAGTHFRYGACVPQYGQSGGGVEIMFTHAFKNVGPIANPVVLPIF